MAQTTITEFSLNDKVIVNGNIYGNGHGTGTATEKKNATMYVVGFARADRYDYNIAVASTKGGTRLGWVSPKSLTKVSSQSAPRTTMEIKAKQTPASGLSSLLGDYAAAARIYIRDGAGSHSDALTALPQGQVVTCVSGKYTSFNGTKWLYVETVHQNIKYTGFCSSEYLIKLLTN